MRPRTRRMIVAFLPCVMLAAVTAHGVDCYEQIDPYYWEFDVPAMIHVRTADEAARVRASVIDYMWNGRGFPEGALPARVDHLPCAGDPPPVKGPYPSDLPKTLPGLVAWYDASSSVKQRNGRVWIWQDKSGLANHSAQAVVERQPLFAATGLNGKPAVYFDGVDDELDALDSPTLDPETMTLFLVLKAASTNNVSLPIPLAKLPLNAAYNFMIAADDTPAATVNVGAGLLTTQEMDPVAGQAEIWVGSYGDTASTRRGRSGSTGSGPRTWTAWTGWTSRSITGCTPTRTSSGRRLRTTGC